MSNQIYAVRSVAPGKLKLEGVWGQQGHGQFAAGYTCAVALQVGARTVLFAHNKTTQATDVYALTAADPWVAPLTKSVVLSGGPWDSFTTLVLGNIPYLVAYRADNGLFAFFPIGDDLSTAKPYNFQKPRNTPTLGFTTIAPFTVYGAQYFLGYNFNDGTVAVFSLAVTNSTSDGTPPLIGQNVWYHKWAKGWTRFAFFQLGGSNFFFKINLDKLNVNIDHMQDNPTAGTIEVGTSLQSQLPDAASIDIAATVPWSYGEPYVLTYVAATGATSIYEIHADCLGWTQQHAEKAVPGAGLIVPYRIGDVSYTLFYGGKE